MMIDALYKVGNTYFFMVDEKMTFALNNYYTVFASFCVSKNVKQTWKDLSFYFQY